MYIYYDTCWYRLSRQRSPSLGTFSGTEPWAISPPECILNGTGIRYLQRSFLSTRFCDSNNGREREKEKEVYLTWKNHEACLCYEKETEQTEKSKRLTEDCELRIGVGMKKMRFSSISTLIKLVDFIWPDSWTVNRIFLVLNNNFRFTIWKFHPKFFILVNLVCCFIVVVLISKYIKIHFCVRCITYN